jgi:uncharacterized protein YqhQ
MKKEQIYIGGQAAMEGVMMRGKTVYALAVRTPDKTISVVTKPVSPRDKGPLSWPIIRGVAAFIDSLFMGVKVIYDSSEMSGMDDLTEEKPTKFDLWLEKTFGDKLFKYMMGLSVFLSVGLGILIFMLLPTFLAGLLNSLIGLSASFISVFEGILRLGIFLGYMALISKMKEIQRVFEYHGAEHKTINCLESGDELTPENAMKHSRLHRRCGTSFLLIVMLVSMVFFMFVSVESVWLRLLTRVLFVPLIAGISYEIIRWAGRNDSAFVRAVSAPGMLLQKLSTKEPDLSQIEVAIKATTTVLEKDGSAAKI